VAGTLKYPLIGQAYRCQHAMGDGVDSNRASHQRRFRPSIRSQSGVVPVPVHDQLVTLVPVREVACSPDQSLPRLLLNTSDAGIHPTVGAQTIGVLVIETEAFKES